MFQAKRIWWFFRGCFRFELWNLVLLKKKVSSVIQSSTVEKLLKTGHILIKHGETLDAFPCEDMLASELCACC